MYCWATGMLQPCCYYASWVEAAVMEGLIKPACTSQKSSCNVPKGIRATLAVGSVLDSIFKLHHYRKKRQQNSEQPQIEKEAIPQLQNLLSTTRIKHS